MKLKPIWVVVFAAMPIASVFVAQPAHAEPRRIEVTARRFAFIPANITVKKGEPVVIVLKSVDVAHGLRFRGLGLDVKAGNGKTGEAAFTPNKTGDFVGQCSVFCGSGHGSMKLTLHVVE